MSAGVFPAYFVVLAGPIAVVVPLLSLVGYPHPWSARIRGLW
jgi:hypothetical protein